MKAMMNTVQMLGSKVLMVLAVLPLLVGCLNNDFGSVPEFDAEAQMATDLALIDDYLTANGLTALRTESGLHYRITQNGSGALADSGNVVRVDYVGYDLEDKVFDTSISLIAQANDIFVPERDYIPLEFTLGQNSVIQGWEEGLSLLNAGSKATFYIPSGLAYGPFGTASGQFANQVLIFDVELLEIR